MKKKSEIIRAQPRRMSVSAPVRGSGYEKDFSKWASTQANFLKKREFSKLDIENLIEEIEDLSKREKQRLTSYLEILLMHKLKIEYQPKKHTKSWDLTIKEADHKAQKTLLDNPSLKSKLNDIVDDAYFSARLRAAVETKLDESKFPEICPWDLKDIFPNLEKKYC